MFRERFGLEPGVLWCVQEIESWVSLLRVTSWE